jgi:predicted  nucleic acid-binding Zn-ribbon protein
MNKQVRTIALAVSMASAFSWAVPGVLWHAPAAYGEDTPASVFETVRASEVRQHQIQSQTQRTSEELGTIIAEFEANGLGDSADVKILRAIQKALGQLSDKQMEDVITLLAQAHQKQDPTKAKTEAVRAFTEQKTIVVAFQKLLAEYERQQELIALSLRLGQLAERQNANLKLAKAFYKAAPQLRPEQYNETQRTLLQVQTAEQNAIRDEVQSQLDALGTLIKDVDSATADKLNHVLEQAKAGKLDENLRVAADDLKAGRFHSATGRELALRDQLRELSRLVAPAKDPQALLRAAAEQLARDLRQEKQIRTATGGLAGDKDQMTTDAATLEDQQADLVDETDQLRKDLADIAADAATDLEQGQLAMQRVRKGLNDLAKDEAVKQAEVAETSLESARTKVLEALARMEKLAAATDALARVEELLKRVTALRIEQETLRDGTRNKTDAKVLAGLAEREGGLLRSDRDLAALALLQAAAAVRPLQEAGKQMDAAQVALGTQLSSPDAISAQELAIDSLKQAEQLLREQEQMLAQAKKDLEALQAAREKVAQAMVAQEKLAAAAERNAALQNKKPDATTQPAPSDAKPADPKDLAKNETDVAKTTDEAKADVADKSKDATDALDKAHAAMDDAKKALDNADAQQAAPKARDALDDLAQAKDALDKQIADLQNKLDDNPDKSGKLDDLAKALDQAQHDLDKAMDPQQDPLNNLADAQKKIADDLQQMKNDGQPVGDAQKDAQKAADDLAKADLPAAKDAMDQAMAAMDKAAQDPAANPPVPDAKDPAAPPAEGAPHPEDAGAPHPENGPPHAGGKPTLPQAQKDQAAAKAALDQMIAQNQNADPPPTAAELEKIAGDLEQAAANDEGALPEDADKAMADAEKALADAGAKAAAGQKPDAQAKAAEAQAAITQAQASLAMAKAGLSKQATAQGKPMPGMKPGDKPAEKSSEHNAQKGKGDRQDAKTDADTNSVARKPLDPSAFVGLPPRDRGAIQQSRNDRYPEEYGPQIEQYLKNLSDQTK